MKNKQHYGQSMLTDNAIYPTRPDLTIEANRTGREMSNCPSVSEEILNIKQQQLL